MRTLLFKTLTVSFVLLIVLGNRSLAQEGSLGVTNQSATPSQAPTPSQGPTLPQQPTPSHGPTTTSTTTTTPAVAAVS